MDTEAVLNSFFVRGSNDQLTTWLHNAEEFFNKCCWFDNMFNHFRRDDRAYGIIGKRELQ